MEKENHAINSCKSCFGQPQVYVQKVRDGWDKRGVVLCENCQVYIYQDGGTWSHNQTPMSDENIEGILITKWNKLNS